jgi:hypothetical protein
MKKIAFILFISIINISIGIAQDEGSVVKRERIDRDKSIFVGGGVSTVLGNNFGDYSTGINFEGGYLKRLNRIVSIGGSISYLKFKFDPNILKGDPNKGGGFVPNFYYNQIADDGYLLNLTGGDITMISAAFNIKVNFVPVKDNSTISIYAFAKPFISNSTRTEVSGLGEYYYYDNIADDYLNNPNSNEVWGKDQYSILGEKSNITGGVFIGPGIEIFPAKKVSVFLQASFGYTFPVNIVSTKSYGNYNGLEQRDYNDPNFPMTDLSFTSINFAGGISFNLD